MTPPDIKPADLSQTLLLQALEEIGGLSREVSIVQGQNNIIIQEQGRAAEGRRIMHDKLNKIDPLIATVARIEPLVQKHEDKHNQALGAMWVGRTLWIIVSGGVGAAITLLFNKFGGH